MHLIVPAVQRNTGNCRKNKLPAFHKINCPNRLKRQFTFFFSPNPLFLQLELFYCLQVCFLHVKGCTSICFYFLCVVSSRWPFVWWNMIKQQQLFEEVLVEFHIQFGQKTTNSTIFQERILYHLKSHYFVLYIFYNM